MRLGRLSTIQVGSRQAIAAFGMASLLAVVATAAAAPAPPTMSLRDAVNAIDIDQVERNLYWCKQNRSCDLWNGDPSRRTLLHIAAHAGRLRIVRRLVDAGADVNARFDHLTWGANGQTALLEAVERDQVEIATMLVKAGADVNAATSEGRTPLVVARSPEIVRLLLDAGARTEVSDTDGDTALHHAASGTNRASAVFVSTSERPEDVTKRRDWFVKQTESLRLLLAAGGSVSARDRSGATPLHSAAQAGNLPAMDLLLQSKADIAAGDANGATPLHYAARGGSVEAARRLLDAGADVNARTAQDETPSSWARGLAIFSSDGHTQLLKLFREHGATPFPSQAVVSTTAAAKPSAETRRSPKGRILDKSNAADFAPHLGPVHSWLLERGAKLELGEYRKASLPNALLEATRTYAGRVYFDGSTSLINYVAGIPFERIDATESGAASKVMLNVEAANSVDDLQVSPISCDTGALAKNPHALAVERHFQFGSFYRMTFAARWQAEPKPKLEPNRDAVRYKEAMSPFLEPFDVRGNMWVSSRYLADDKPMDTWLFLPQVRRVRRISPIQRSQPLFGQDIDLDSIGGLAAPVANFYWRLLGERTVLSPFHAESVPVEWSESPWSFLPNSVWEPRRVWEIEGRPKDAEYPYAKRVVYVDQETYRIVLANLYDRSGELERTWLSGWKFDDVPGRLSYASFATMIDVQLEHATWCSLPSRESADGGWYINTGDMDECVFEIPVGLVGNPCPAYGSPMRSRRGR